jgi:hypothetical protein
LARGSKHNVHCSTDNGGGPETQKAASHFFPSLIEGAAKLATTRQPFSAVNEPEAEDQCKKAKR